MTTSSSRPAFADLSATSPPCTVDLFVAEETPAADVGRWRGWNPAAAAAEQAAAIRPRSSRSLSRIAWQRARNSEPGTARKLDTLQAAEEREVGGDYAQAEMRKDVEN